MIRLITVIGHGANLLPHFIEHYSHHVDEIQLIVYKHALSPNIEDEVKGYIKNYNNVKIVKTVTDRIFDWEKVTSLYNMVRAKKPNDWWVIADIDEFHLYPDDDLKMLVSDCDKNGWDIVRGGFIDRIGPNGNFAQLTDDVLIWKQFPNAGFFRHPMSKACPNKICVLKGNIEVTSGQHYAKIDYQTTWKWQGWNHPLIAPTDTHTIQVHHFKWDKTAITRIKDVADLNEGYSYSKEYELMYLKLLKTKFKIELNNPDFMFELGLTRPEFNLYKNWNKLIKKIISI
jgi:hypothetical protein